MAKMKLKSSGGGKNVKASQQPMIKPNAKVEKQPVLDKDVTARDMDLRQAMANNRTSKELSKDIDAYRASAYHYTAKGDTKTADLARRAALDRESALTARKKTNEQDRKYITKTIAPKYSEGGTVGTKKSLTGKVVKKAKPVAPAYLPSSKTAGSRGNILGASQGGDPTKQTKNLSTSISGAGMAKSLPKKMKLAKK